MSVINAKLATLHELQTIYGIRDLADFQEIIKVNQFNDILESLEKKDGN